MPRSGYRKPADEARSYSIKVRLNPAEKSHLEKCVAASDVTGNADFVRRRIMGFEIKRPPSDAKLRVIDELAALNRKLSSIDNNMNQLAKAANSGNPYPIKVVLDQLHHLKKLRELAAHKLNELATRR